MAVMQAQLGLRSKSDWASVKWAFLRTGERNWCRLSVKRLLLRTAVGRRWEKLSQNVYVEIENAPQLLDCLIILIMQFLSQGNFLFRRQKIQLSHIKFLSSHFEGYRTGQTYSIISILLNPFWFLVLWSMRFFSYNFRPRHPRLERGSHCCNSNKNTYLCNWGSKTYVR